MTATYAPFRPYVVEDLRGGYTELVRKVLNEGNVVKPRGYKTYEIEDACFQVRDTRRLLPMHVGRELKPEIGLAEALLLCGGLASPSLLTNVSSSFSRFMDGGVHHGAYGPRVRPQLESVVRRLRSDRDSRQAIVQIWDPLYDGVDTRDMPCTLGFGFRIRNDQLHMSSTMRSQDVWLGLAYDLFFFGQLGHTIANVLSIEFATLTHHAYSFHLYERNLDQVDALLDEPERDYIEPRGFGWQAADYEFARGRAEMIYNREQPAALTQSELCYAEGLSMFMRQTRSENFTS